MTGEYLCARPRSNTQGGPKCGYRELNSVKNSTRCVWRQVRAVVVMLHFASRKARFKGQTATRNEFLGRTNGEDGAQ